MKQNEAVVLLANLAPGADRNQVKARIGGLLQDYPQFKLYWGADLRAEQRQTISQAFGGTDLLLVVLIVPSLLGPINTLAINVLERTQEIGELRAIGATRMQIWKLVLAESLLPRVAGAALGMLAGLALGYGLTAMLAAIMLPSMTFSFPLDGLIAAAAVALVMVVRQACCRRDRRRACTSCIPSGTNKGTWRSTASPRGGSPSPC